MCFLVNSPPAAGEKISGSMSHRQAAWHHPTSSELAAAAGPMNAGYFRRAGPEAPAGFSLPPAVWRLRQAGGPGAGAVWQGRPSCSPGGGFVLRCAVLSVLSEDAPVGASPGGNAKEVTRHRRRMTTTV
jgi:hypothetical protein